MVKDTNFGTHIDSKIRPMAIVTVGDLSKGAHVEGYIFSTSANGFAKKAVSAKDVENFLLPKNGTAFVTVSVFAAKFYAEIKDARYFRKLKKQHNDE